jgi:NAD(P)H-dependent FMN reductase
MPRRTVKFLVFGASLRAESLNHRLADLAAGVIRKQGGTVDVGRMAEFDCTPFNGDVERDVGFPEPARELCRRLQGCDAFVIASPEYNASMPGHLKNSIDWVSRFRPQPFNGKQALLLSASPSMVGGNRGLWSLRVPLEHLGARIYPDMFSLAQAHEAFIETASRLRSDVLQQRLETTVTCFMDLVEAAKHYPTMKKQWVEFLGERPDATIDRVEDNSTQAA